MKVKLFVCGVDRGEIEVGDNSLVAKLAYGDFPGAMEKAKDLKADIDKVIGESKLAMSTECGNCGVFREVGEDGLVETCPNCGDDEYYNWDIPDVP